MDTLFPPPIVIALLPAACMALAVPFALKTNSPTPGLWRRFIALAGLGLAFAVLALASQLLADSQGGGAAAPSPWLAVTPLGAGIAVLVQLLGTVIASFSSRYLEGETNQPRFVAALAGVLLAVHLLLLANHWLVLIAAWGLIGVALERLLCFYPERPLALLAAHKKYLADRLADALLVAAMLLAWSEVGSGSFSALWQHIADSGPSLSLQSSAVCLALAVILRTGLFPVHGWLTQVMEAPTPVSALLHAGVVNLGGFILIRFAPLLELAPAARWLLVGFGLATAVLAGLVMLTRVTIKLRLAWSTMSQMGFMVLECGLGLYTLAALHLVGHSLYKAHAFLSSSEAVQNTRAQMLRGPTRYLATSLVAAPAIAWIVITLLQSATATAHWPGWWSGVLALAWAPLLWQAHVSGMAYWRLRLWGVTLVATLTALALAAHPVLLAWGPAAHSPDAPLHAAGWVTLGGMAGLYGCLVLLQLRPTSLSKLRRWSYAGFYVDELYTRMALELWPTRWAHTNPSPATRAQQ
jgi:NAD(P)H-quinone oxidoreductase subunit 5